MCLFIKFSDISQNIQVYTQKKLMEINYATNEFNQNSIYEKLVEVDIEDEEKFFL
jgi:hypothetical protein